MDWLALFAAGLFEILFTICLAYSEGFTKPLPTIIMIGAMICSFSALSYSIRTIPLGTAYAVWTAIGAVGTALFGMAFLGESREPLRLLCILFIIGGVVGLKLTHQ